MIYKSDESLGKACLSAALGYARRGWRVLPLHTVVDGRCSCDKPTCGSPGKHPLTRRGLKEASADENTIRRWWAEAPEANVGIATGPVSGLFMLGPDGQAGLDALAELEHLHGSLPPTPWLRSGGGGRHYYFEWPAEGRIKTGANYHGVPIDVRGDGGLAVAPPSMHVSGKSYEWEVTPETAELAPASAWLLEWLRTGKGTSKVKSALPQRGSGLVLTVQAESGTDVQQRAIAYLEKCLPAVSGQRGHDQTFEVTRAVVYGFDLGPEAGYDLLSRHYNVRCVPPWSDAELRHKCQEADAKPFDKPRGYLLAGRNGAEDTAFPRPSAASVSEGEDDIEALPMPPPTPWPELPPEALYGLAGEVVQTLAPETESDPAAILGQLVVAVGSAVGRGPHFPVEGDAHRANLYACLVGASSRGRKGTSRGRVMQLFTYADKQWCERCVISGLSSGEGLIWAVRDAIEGTEPIKEKGRVTGYQKVVTDEGVQDKRLLVVESEFAQVLRVMQREGNSLSPTIRQAWDTGDLRTLVKNNPARATGAHISIAGHITRAELAKYLKNTETLNGFANRFLWLCVRRARLLPDGGRSIDLSPLGACLSQALASARNIGRMSRSPAAGERWHDAYPVLTAERAGVYGAVTGRAEAQVLRLSMVYALMDGTDVIEEPHLQAALALWAYADTSARLIFGAEVEDPLLGLVREKLRQAPDGLTRSQLRDAFHRNIKAAVLLAALAELRDRGEASAEPDRQTGGRPAERWRLRGNAETRKDSGAAGGAEGLTALPRYRVGPSPENGVENGGEEVMTL